MSLSMLSFQLYVIVCVSIVVCGHICGLFGEFDSGFRFRFMIMMEEMVLM